MGKTYRALKQEPERKHQEPWWVAVCRAGRHAWTVTVTDGLFSCSRCGEVGTCAHYQGRLKGAVRVPCGAWCQRVECCRRGVHTFVALPMPGWFECLGCGVQGACGHITVIPPSAVRVPCRDSCYQVEWEGYER